MKSMRPIAGSLASISRPCSPLGRAAFARVSQPIWTNHDRHHVQSRTFLSNPFASSNSEPQTITATRLLPYAPSQIYNVISNIAEYKHYFPFCLESTVTKWSDKAGNGKAYPEEAKLVIGFNENTPREEFWSRVYCVPETSVEAVSGNAETSLSKEDVSHHSSRSSLGSGSEDRTRNTDVLERLLTRWTLSPRSEPDPSLGEFKTQVHLAIELRFANPLYAAMSQAAVPKVAEKMIDAFEKRLREVTERGDRS